MGNGEGRRVVIAVADYLPWRGGTTNLARNVAIGLAERGWETEILTQRVDPDWPTLERIDGIIVRRLQPSARDSRSMHRYLFANLRSLRSARHATDAVVAIMTPDLATGAVFAGLGRRTAMVWAGSGDVHDALHHDHPSRAGRVVRFVRRRALRRVSHIALTRAIGDEVRASRTASRAVTIPTPIDAERFHPPATAERAAARASLLVDDEFTIVFSGHLRALKRVDALIRAVRLLTDGGSAVRLFILGSGRADLVDTSSQLMGLVDELGLVAIVTFTGAVDDVERYLAAADAFVLPSEREGLSNSLLEAMASGLACVAPESAGGAEVLDNDCGIVPPTNAPEALAAALQTLIDDPELRARLATNAATRAEMAHRPIVIDAYDNLLTALTDRR